jgi:hypothetical protein
MRFISKRGWTAVPLLLFIGACSDVSSPNAADEATVDLDVARYVADQTVDDVTLMNTEADRAAVLVPAAPAVCRRAQHRFECERDTWAGNQSLQITREVTFYDADGNVQDGYDPDSTAAINFYFLLEGERSNGFVSGTVSRERDFTASGLLGAETERTWDGTGSTKTSRTGTSDSRGSRTYDMSSSMTADSVVIAVPRDDSWPLAGTITRNVHVEVVDGLGDTRTRERTVVITFNGTHLVSITINGETTCELDLETHDVTCDS